MPSIGLYEMRGLFGGRIETWTLDLGPHGPQVATVPNPYDPAIGPDRKQNFYRAEFGPMRIEPRDQPLLSGLLNCLGICEPSTRQKQDQDLVKFPAYASDAPVEPKYPLVGEEAEQQSLLDLLLLAARRIFELVDEDGRRPEGRPVAWASPAANISWGQFLGKSSVRRQYWKGELHDFIVSLGDDDYDIIRRTASVNGTLLCNMGFWNLLSEVLSHLAVLRIRDWGSYYHLIGENPNAAEHLVMWLRAIKSSEYLKGIRGGMGLMVHRLVELLKSAPYRNCVTLWPEHALVSLNPDSDHNGEQVRLHFANNRSVMASEVILAMPKRPLERLNIPGITKELDKVQDIPLLKVFFVVDQPWWEDDRPPNRFAGDLPTREIHYWKNDDKTRGVIMIYTDRPALHFWTDYLTAAQPGIDRCDGGVDAQGDDELCREQQTASIWILERTKTVRRPRDQPAALAAVRPVRARLRAQRLHHGASACVRDSGLGEGSVRGGGARLEASRQVLGSRGCVHGFLARRPHHKRSHLRRRLLRLSGFHRRCTAIGGTGLELPPFRQQPRAGAASLRCTRCPCSLDGSLPRFSLAR